MNPGERQKIHKFLDELMQENYSVANKYLQEVIDLKVKNRIAKAKKQKLFNNHG